MKGSPFRKSLLLGVVTTLLFVLGVACGNGNGNDTGAPPADTNGEVTVEATEFEFDPDGINVSSGEFTIALRNVGTQEHDFLIEGVDDETAEMEHLIHAMPGETDRGDYDLDDGTYTFYCSIPGHRQSGMEGSLTVG